METQHRKKPGKLLLLLVVLLVLIIGGLAFVFMEAVHRPLPIFQAGQTDLTPADGYESSRVQALGRLEPEGGVITISGPVGDRLETIFAQEGAEVTRGQELARLESYDDRVAARDLAAAQLQEARRRLEAITLSGAKQVQEAELEAAANREIEPLDIEAQKAKIDLLADQLSNARRNQERIKALGKDGLSSQEIEQQELLVHQAEVELVSARARLKKTEKLHSVSGRSSALHLEALRAKVRAEAEIPVESLEKSLHVTEEQLKHSVICAPVKGRILKVLAHPGENVGGVPILRMANTRQMLAIAEVYETDIGRVHRGQKAVITSHALAPHELSGTVEEVGHLIARNRVVDIDPAADADRRVLDVKIRLDDSEHAAQLINLQVSVSIKVDEPPLPSK